MTTANEWFATTYNDIIVEAGPAGLTTEKSFDALAHAYADAVESGDLARYQPDIFNEGLRLAKSFVSPLRDKRRRSMRKQCEYLIAALSGSPDEEANIDAMLDLAYPIGRADGMDKALRFWTGDDWQHSRAERYRNAASAAQAAQEYDLEIVVPILNALNHKGARFTEDLFQ